MSTENWIEGVGTGALAGAQIGNYVNPGWGTVIGGISGALTGAAGAIWANDEEKKAAKMTGDQTTPYKVKLPSGATITMYAHGKGREYAAKPVGQSVNAGLETTAALAKQYGDAQAKKPGGKDYDAGKGGSGGLTDASNGGATGGGAISGGMANVPPKMTAGPTKTAVQPTSATAINYKAQPGLDTDEWMRRQQLGAY